VITILGQPFEVVYEPRGELVGDNAGTSTLNDQRLAVLEGQGQHQERDTVVHEVLHLVSRMSAFPLKERQVTALSPVLLDVLRRNPELVAYLTEAIA
jgi:hypothetical protein